MNKKEFSTFAMALRTFYPRENLLPNNAAMELWYQELQDLPSEVAETSLRKWVATNKWSPTIADLREVAAGIIHGNIPDWSEAWEKVLAAVRKYNPYDDVSYKTLLDNDEMIISCVDKIGFIKICNSDNINVERATFKNIYEQAAERKQKHYQVPERVHQMIASVHSGLLECKEG